MANQADVSRRLFIKMAGLGGFGVLAGVAGCDGRPSGGDGWMPAQYEGRGHFPVQVRGRVPIDPLNPSICRDDQKCILCGQCAEVCDKYEAVHDHYELPLVDDIPCVHCGQCTLWCPTGAITETSGIKQMLEALDPKSGKHVLVQTAPSTRVGLGEEFGMDVGTNVEGLQVAALRALGAKTVFDTNFAADMTIYEEAFELVQRLTGKIEAPIPMFTSCCPAWVKFSEYFYPELRPNLSTAKSPMGMVAPLFKTFYAEKQNIDPKTIFSVAIMPCTAKKFEAARPEMNAAGRHHNDPDMRDTDLVLTTRELAQLIKMKGLDLHQFKATEYAKEREYDRVMSEYSGGGAIFGCTGGVMEAAARTAYHFVTGAGKDEIPELLYNFEPIRGLKGIKSAKLDVPGVGELRVAVATGLANAKELMGRVKKNLDERKVNPDVELLFHFIEVMACPGGCISGGGQPKSSLPPSDIVRTARSNALYTIDERLTLRLSHENAELLALYKAYLPEGPNGHEAHEFLHIHDGEYRDRSGNLVAKR